MFTEFIHATFPTCFLTGFIGPGLSFLALLIASQRGPLKVIITLSSLAALCSLQMIPVWWFSVVNDGIVADNFMLILIAFFISHVPLAAAIASLLWWKSLSSN